MFKNNNLFMQQTRVRSVSNGFITDESGRCLQLIGTMPLKAGDAIWTDGRVAYGHRPARPTIKPFYAGGGYPVLAGGIDGYITKSGKYKAKALKLDVSNKYLINNDDKIFGLPNDFQTRLHVIDAENNLGQNSYEKNQYYAATFSKTHFSTSNVSFDGSGKITSGQPYLSSDDFIRTNIVIDSVSIGYSSTGYLNPFNYCENITKDIANKCNCKEGFLNFLTAQLLDFRFIDNNKNWEAIVVYCANGQITVPPPIEEYTFEYTEKSNDDVSYSLIDKSVFMGDNYIYKYLQTTTKTPVVKTGITKIPDVNLNLYNVRITAKIDSKGKFTILQRRIQTDESKETYITKQTLRWEKIEETYDIPTDAKGSYSRIYNYLGKEDSSFEELTPVGGSMLWYQSFDIEIPVRSFEMQEYTIDAIDINENPKFDIALNSGYKAKTDVFNLYDIRQGNNVVLNKLDCCKKAYLIELLPTSSISDYAKGKGWDVKKIYSDGVIIEEHSNEPPGYYVEGNMFHLIPHVCLVALNEGYLLAYRSAYLKGGLYRIINGIKTLLGNNANNLRFNYMNRVKAFAKPENRNRI